MTHYDAIIVLGSKPHPVTWRFPAHVKASLNRAAERLAAGDADYIAVSGKWALVFDRHHIQPPFAECDEMARYLLGRGVPEGQIVREGRSKDTIANLYHLKHLLADREARRLLIITADFRVPRLRYLAHKIFGPHYSVTIEAVSARRSEVYPHEADTLRRTKQFLRHMEPGDDGFLTYKFYHAHYYTAPYVSASKLGVQPRSHHL
ncbi:MAG TPA: YdcF family protein [Candidatus Saccharimonadia bacterium]|nr:YdcF family protein [Candidatus Saccharimonadia bacterium]